ncbi:hypothetical protein V2J09_023984 [Rumex salicifolius]
MCDQLEAAVLQAELLIWMTYKKMVGFASSTAAAAVAGGGGGGGTPPSMIPAHTLAMIPAITATIVIAAKTTTSVSMDRRLYWLELKNTAGGGGGWTSGGS